jgi:YD repeat-containing protein
MVSIVGGSELGLNANSGRVLGGQGETGTAGQGRAGEGVTINAVTGNLVLQRRDEFVDGQGLDLNTLRTYNSQGLYDGDNDDQWALSYSRRITGYGYNVFVDGDWITRDNEEGVTETYIYESALDAYVYRKGDGSYDTITFVIEDEMVTNTIWTDGTTQTREIHDFLSGMLQKIVDINGNEITITRDEDGRVASVTNERGEKTEFVYGTGAALNNVLEVRTRSTTGALLQTRVRYGYDGSQRLTSVTVDLSPTDNSIADGKTYVTTYTYDGASKRIASIGQTDGSRLEFTYQNIGGKDRVTEMRDVRPGDTRTTTFSYDTVNRTTSITDPRAGVTQFKYDTSDRVISIRSPEVNGAGLLTQFAYDTNDNVVSVTDPRGKTTFFEYDSHGNRVLERDVLGNTITRIYGARNQLLSETTYTVRDTDGAGTAVLPQGAQTTHYAYDAALNLRFVMTPDGRVTEYRYDGFGQRISELTYAAGVFDTAGSTLWNQAFGTDASGFTMLPSDYMTVSGGRLAVINKANATAEYKGIRSTSSYPFGTGFRGEVTLDATSTGRYLIVGADNGQPGAYRRVAAYFQNGQAVALVNDISGSHQFALGAVAPNKTYVVEVETLQSGAVTLYVYEKGTDRAAGYQYTAQVPDWRTSWQSASLYVETYGGPGQAAVTTWLDNLGTYIPGNWSSTLATAAGLDALPANMAVVAGGLRVQTQSAASEAWPAVFGSRRYALGAQFQAEVNTGAASVSRYLLIGASTGSGTPAYRAHAAYFEGGNIYAHVFDANGRRNILLGTALNNTTYMVDVVTEADGTSTLYVYEKGKGRASGYVDRQQIAGATQLRTFVEGHVGPSFPTSAMIVSSLTETPAPLGTLEAWAAGQSQQQLQRTDYTYNTRGQVSTSTTYAALDANGAGIVDGTQATAQYFYDPSGQLTQVIRPEAGASLDYAYDGLGRLLSSRNESFETTLYTYDDINNKTAIALENGLVTTTQYDAAGRVLSVVRSDASSTNLGTTIYTYNKNGQLLTETDPTQQKKINIYDAAGRLVQTIDAQNYSTEYFYNANDQIVKTVSYTFSLSALDLVNAATATAAIRPMQVPTDHHEFFVYDAVGRLVKSIDAVGAVIDYTYDGAGQLVKTERRANMLNSTQLNSLRLVAEIDLANTDHAGYVSVSADTANDRVTRRLYTAGGLLAGELDGEGYLTEYRYDGAGRNIETIRYATQSNTAHWASGTLTNLRPADNPSDQHTYTLYNLRGGVAGVVDAEGYLTEYRYLESGEKAYETRYAQRVVYAAGKTVAQLRPSVVDTEDQQIAYYYTAGGRLEYVYRYSGALVTDVLAVLPTGTSTYYLDYDVYANPRVIATYAGSPASLAVSPHYRILQKQYDTQGRLVAEMTPQNYLKSLLGTVPEEQLQTRYRYDSAGRMLAKIDPIDSEGRNAQTLYFYDAESRLTHIISANGEVARTLYGVWGEIAGTRRYVNRLSAQTLQVLAALTNGVADNVVNNALTNIQSQMDVTESFVVNARGEATLRSTGGAALWHASYNAFGEQSVYGPGGTSISRFDNENTYDRRGLLKKQTGRNADGTVVISEQYTTFDAFGRLTQRIDGNGGIWTKGYDKLGREIVVKATGETLGRTFTYDAFARVATETDALGKTTTYTYDSANRSVAIKTPENITTTYIRNEHDETVTVVDGRGNSTSYVYDDDGRLLSTTSPKGTGTDTVATSSAYDSAGHVIETTDANGVKTRYIYDVAGRMITRVVDPSTTSPAYTGLNLTTHTLYDGAGAAIWSRAANGIWTQTEYDEKGQVVAVTVDPLRQPILPAGATITLDASDSTRLNLRTTYTYTLPGRLQLVTEGAGSANPRVTLYGYDLKGRLASERIDYNTLDITTSYTYDANDNLITRTDANNLVTRFVYDAKNQQIYSVDATGAVVKTQYDAAGRVIAVTSFADRLAPSTLTASTEAAVLAGLGAASGTYATNPKNKVDRTVYDKDGRVRFSIDNALFVTAFTYDNNGNVVRTTRYSAQLASLPATLDDATLTPLVQALANNSLDQTTRAVYDKANRAIFTIDAKNYVTQLFYDNAGRVTRTAQYANAMVGTLADGASPQILSSAGTGAYVVLSPTQDRVHQTVYDASGRVAFQLDALNYVTQYVYDDSGNVLRTTRFVNALQGSTGSIDSLKVVAVGGTQPASGYYVQAHANDQSDRTVYDKANRAIFSIDTRDCVTERVFDALGRVRQVTRYATGMANMPLADGQKPTIIASGATAPGVPYVRRNALDQTESFVYDAAGRQTYKVDAENYVTRRTYDGSGRVLSETRYATALTVAFTPSPTQNNIPAYTTHANDRTTRHFYDQVGRERFAVDGEGYVVGITYDYAGREIQRVQYGRTLATMGIAVADGATLALEAALPSGHATDVTTTNAYGSRGYLNTATDGNGIVTTYLTDAFGNRMQMIRAANTPDASTTKYTYDQLNRQVELIEGADTPAAATTRYTLDAFGNRVQTLASRGIELTETDTDWAKATRVSMGYSASLSGVTADQKKYLASMYTSLQEFDTEGRVIRSVDPKGMELAGSDHISARNLRVFLGYPSALADVTPAQKVALQNLYATRKSYDAFGNMVKVTDPRGNSGYFYYNRGNQLALEVDPDGYGTYTVFDAFGMTAWIRRYVNPIAGATVGVWPTINGDDALDQIVLIEHDRRNLQTKITDGEQNVEQASYNAFGDKKSYTTKFGGVYDYTYDKRGLVKQETAPQTFVWLSNEQTQAKAGAIKQFSYDARGNMTQQIEAFGLTEQRTTTYTYDKENRLKTTTGQAFQQFDPDANAFRLNGSNQPLLVSAVTTRNYDRRGNLIEEIDANGNRTLYYYDVLDRKIAQVEPTAQLITWTYNTGTKPISETSYGWYIAMPATAGGAAPLPLNAGVYRLQIFTYDANNRLLSTTTPQVLVGEQTGSGFVTQVKDLTVVNGYDSNGNLISTTDARGTTTTFYYDKRGNVVRQVINVSAVTEWKYDSRGNVLQQIQYATIQAYAATQTTDATNDRTTVYTYDRLDRVKTKSVLKVAYSTVDASGAMVSGNTASTTSYTYSMGGALNYYGFGQKIVVTDPNGATTETLWNMAGQKVTEIGAEFSDHNNQLVRLYTQYEYNGLGLVAREIERGYGNGTEVDDHIVLYAYNQAGLLYVENRSGDSGASWLYGYDRAGNVTGKGLYARVDAFGANVGSNVRYKYDAANREIWQMDTASGQITETRYNGFGEINGKRVNGGNVNGAWQEIANYDNAGRVWRSNSGDGVMKIYVYDANGNLTMTIRPTELSPDLTQLSLDEILALPAARKAVTINKYDALNRVTDTWQPEDNSAALPVVDYELAGQITVTDSIYYFNSAAKLQFQISAPNFATFEGTKVVLTAYNGTTATQVVTRTFLPGEALENNGLIDTAALNVTTATSVEVVVYKMTANGDVLVFKKSHTDIAAVRNAAIAEASIYGWGQVDLAPLASQSLQLRTASTAKKLVFFHRLADSSGSWTQIVIDAPTGVSGGFFVDISGFPAYSEYRYIALDSSNTVVGAMSGVIFGGAAARAFQSQMPMAGGLALTDSTGKIHVFEMGTNATSGTVKFRIQGTETWGTPVNIGTGGVAGWLVFTPPAGLLADTTYEFMVTGNNNAFYLGSFIKGNWDSVLHKSTIVTNTIAGTTDLNGRIHHAQGYNLFGDVITETDGNNNVTNYTYNTLGKLTKKEEPTANIAMDLWGFLPTITTPTAHRPTTEYTYDLSGRLTSVEDANNHMTKYNLVAGSGVDGTTSSLIAAVFNPDGGIKRTGYDRFGDARKSTDELNRVTLMDYDKAHHVVKVTRPARIGGTQSQASAAQVIETYLYDELGQQIRHTVSPDGSSRQYYDVYGGRVSNTGTWNTINSGSNTYVEYTKYDSLGRVTTTGTFGGNVTSYSYTYYTNIDGVGGRSVGGYQKKTTLQGGQEAYDNVDYFGLTTWHRDYGGHAYEYVYNIAGQLSRQTSSAGQNIAYEYYSNGFIKAIKDYATSRWTEFGYDNNGNRTREQYSTVPFPFTTRTYIQDTTATYDALNRVTLIADTARNFSVQYEYDAFGNRMHVLSSSAYGVQDIWYKYDSMNRFIISQGQLSGTRGVGGTDIVQGASGPGVKITYDLAGQRTSEQYAKETNIVTNGPYSQQYSTSTTHYYTYTQDGYLEQAIESNAVYNITQNTNSTRTSVRTYKTDGMGRVVREEVPAAALFDFVNVVTRTFSADGDVLNSSNRTTSFSYSVPGGPLGGGGAYSSDITRTTVYTYDENRLMTKTVSTSNEANSTEITSHYTYRWYDDAKQIAVTATPYNELAPNWAGGESKFTYNVNGHLVKAEDVVGNRVIDYLIDGQGLILNRTQTVNGNPNIVRNFYFLDGKVIGDTGNNGPNKLSAQPGGGNGKVKDRYKNWKPVNSTNFDNGFRGIDESYPGPSPTTYSVQGGDTLQSIALAVWGDSSQWYILAEANGLSGHEPLAAGMLLTIPNKAVNIHNNTGTHRLYDIGEAMGDTTPTIPDPPPPPKQDDDCGILGIIIVIVITIVVAVLAPEYLPQLGKAWATVIGATVGNAIGQGVAVAVGAQEKFSWQQVATTAISAGVGTGISTLANGAGAFAAALSDPTWGVVLQGALGSIATQGIEVATGLRERFSWTEVAVSAAGAKVGEYVGDKVGSKLAGMDVGKVGEKFWSTTASTFARGVTESVLQGNRPSWAIVAVQSFGAGAGAAHVEAKIQADADAKLLKDIRAEADMRRLVDSAALKNAPPIELKLDAGALLKPEDLHFNLDFEIAPEPMISQQAIQSGKPELESLQQVADAQWSTPTINPYAERWLEVSRSGLGGVLNYVSGQPQAAFDATAPLEEVVVNGWEGMSNGASDVGLIVKLTEPAARSAYIALVERNKDNAVRVLEQANGGQVPRITAIKNHPIGVRVEPHNIGLVNPNGRTAAALTQGARYLDIAGAGKHLPIVGHIAGGAEVFADTMKGTTPLDRTANFVGSATSTFGVGTALEVGAGIGAGLLVVATAPAWVAVGVAGAAVFGTSLIYDKVDINGQPASSWVKQGVANGVKYIFGD